MTERSTSIILGALAGLPPQTLAPFSRSLRATGFRGRIHLVVAGYTPDALDELRGLADHVEPVDDRYARDAPPARAGLAFARRQRGLRRFYPAAFGVVARLASERDSFDRWRNLEYRLEGLQSLRYIHYLELLLRDLPDAEVVMISDLRDVVFQRDPFSDPVTGLELYLEDRSESIGEDGFNTTWLRDLYGESFVKAHRGQAISCSGTVVGTRATMIAYLSEMVGSIVWRRRPMGSHDQGVHNGLIQSGRLSFADVVANEHGRVLTLGKVKNPGLRADGLLMNADGSIPAVIHQWDRHPAIAARLRALHPDREQS